MANNLSTISDDRCQNIHFTKYLKIKINIQIRKFEVSNEKIVL